MPHSLTFLCPFYNLVKAYRRLWIRSLKDLQTDRDFGFAHIPYNDRFAKRGE